MDLAQARRDLAHALEAGTAALSQGDRFRVARQLLVTSGATASTIDPATAAGLADLVERAVHAPASAARRGFAVMLVDALAVPGLLSVRSFQLRLERDIRALAESALPDVLLRANYPFTGDADSKRRFLAGLHASIDEHLRPLEPSIPPWLSGRANS